ncbi:MAG: AAA family ATPase [Oscillospiraceae bacterium]|nr:AAA family ATPase [Oscillospiraceae bacterium]
MFTYIRLKNFMSFGDIEFDFRKNAKTAKNFIALYGENGCGKSNFVKSIDFLCNAITSLSQLNEFQELAENIALADKEHLPMILDMIKGRYDIAKRMAESRMADCNESTEAEYVFLVDGKEWVYRLVFDERFTEESLYGYQDRKSGYIYQLSAAEDGTIEKKFWGGLFKSAKGKEDFLNLIEKYWGKHTFLSIIFNQLQNTNIQYMAESMSSKAGILISEIVRISVCQMGCDRKSVRMNPRPHTLLTDVRNGEIEESDLPKLALTEKILKKFLTQTYADIKDISYETTRSEDGDIEYQLYIDKMIAGKVRRISAEQESAGTQRILDVFRIILGSFFGITVVYDEIDNGIHDLLLKNIIDCARPYITGQLIITTHNTLLLESIDKHSAYLIDVDYEGNKEAICFDEYKIQGTDNMRIKYLKGLFGGTPYGDGVDYDEIISELKEAGEDEENDEVTD